MKILLDESLPRKLKNDFGAENEVRSVREMGWLGKKNGELLKLIMDHKFDIFITVDRNLQYQQNLNNFSAKVFVLCAADNRRITLQKLIPKLFDRLTTGALELVNEISL